MAVDRFFPESEMVIERLTAYCVSDHCFLFIQQTLLTLLWWEWLFMVEEGEG